MPPITPAQIVALQKNSDNIRNICILAHVDHGKTSLSDCLLATNGIISSKLAGRVRYLDSRPDEQLRGITMESSAISLYFRLMRRLTPESEPAPSEYLINLIDSPGHIDFSSEVSTASRLCDGAVVLVDAVEGVCSQTVTVLRQAWLENIRPILIINKMDRLITEIKLTPGEAFTHLWKLLEQVNAVMGSFFAGERMEEDLKWRETLEARLAATKLRQDDAEASGEVPGQDTPESQYEERDDEDIYFAPEKHNVIFASAIDGWAFTVRQFASIYEKKLGIKKSVLEKVLWGEYYLDPKTKRVLGAKHLKGRSLKPMFVQLVLDSIWAVYESTVLERDQERIEKIVKSLNIKVLPRELKSKDTRTLLTSIFSQWLPLSTSVLVTVIEELPSPPVAQHKRIPLIIQSAPSADKIDSSLKTAMVDFQTGADAPIMAFVSKMVAVPEKELKKTTRVQLSAEEMREAARQKRTAVARALAAQEEGAGDEVPESTEASTRGSRETATFSALTTLKPAEPEADKGKEKDEDEGDKERLVGFARLYSGTITVGQELYVLGPKYTPDQPDQHIQKITVTELYYMMGRDLQPLDSVPAGNVFGIGGLEGHILKSGTLCSLPQGGVNLAGVNLGAAPIVRVAVEPKNPSDMGKMVEGLKMLEQADPCAEYIVQETGEHVLLTAGELHLERCLKDLRERFARVDIQSSAPIVPYRESIVAAAEMSPAKGEGGVRGAVAATTPSKQVSISIRVRPLPVEVTEFLLKNSGSIKRLYAERHGNEPEAVAEGADSATSKNEGAALLSLPEFCEGLQKAFDEVEGAEKDVWAGIVEKIAAFGPRRIGPNLLIDATTQGLFRRLLSETSTAQEGASSSARDFEDKFSHAFQLATWQGPLCHEPVQGIACFVEEATVQDEEDDRNRNFEVITVVQNAIKQAFLDWSPRLLMAMYSCDIQASTEVLGKVYAVMTRRRGKILAEEMNEGTPFFTIRASLPVAESFGFGDEIRKRTSGAASPQLIFSGYEMLVDEDPFWTPFTEDELEDLGELADKENVAKKYMDRVRERKGLFVKKKVVVGAEKQKTLKR
ncbi:P-loop containing nucleoside triphosphate hydrolase protein [Morchella snyderi]|nr:P-loop containing nucleoside triphosphate hydrolase protein [Morchella snyderi]